MILIGMGQVDKKLMRYKHLWDRLSEVVKFNELSQADISRVAAQLCETPLSEDAVSFIHGQGTRFRRVMLWLYRAEAVAKRNRLSVVAAADLRGLEK